LKHHTDVREISDKSILGVATEPVKEAVITGSLDGSAGAAAYAVAHTGSNNMITLRYRLKDLKVQAAGQPFKISDREFPAGSFIIAGNQGGKDVYSRVKSEVEKLGLTAASISSIQNWSLHEVDIPRVAVFSTWGNTQEVGWARYGLDRFEINYDLIFKERVKKGNLRASYDLIIIPNQSGSAKRLVYDIEPRGKPLAYMKSDRFKSLGMYGESEDISGGMGIEGVAELQKFIEQGGVMMTLGTASFFPAEFGLTRRIDAGRTSAQFYAPGPIVEAEILQPGHPVFYGYTQKTLPVRYANGPLLQVPQADRDEQVLMQLPGGDKSVLSGLMRGAAEIRNRPVIVDVPVGRGRVLLFATNPCYRWQNHGEFNMLFNAVLHYNDIKPADKKMPVSAGTK
jgi:hypothetical protein